MKARARAVVVLVAALTLLVLRPTPSAAQTPPPAGVSPAAPDAAAIQDARTRSARGVELFRAGDFRAALIEFRRAYDLAPNYRVLYNIGQSYYKLRDYAGALRTLSRYLADGGSEVSADRRAQVEEDLKELQGLVAQVEVEVQPKTAGVDLALDEESLGRSPLKEAVLVGAGRHVFTASSEGRVIATRTVEVAGVELIRVVLELPAPKLASSPTPRRPTVVSGVRRPWFWVGLVSTAALAAGATATGVAALDARAGYRGDLQTFGVNGGKVQDDQQEMRNLALVTDLLGGAAIVAAGLTVVAAAIHPRSSAAVAVLPTGVCVSGTF